MAFKPATKEKAKLRLALIGPSGSGKTFTALTLAKSLGTKIAVIDSERGSASKYSDMFRFDVDDLNNHAPQTYVQAIKEAEKAGYEVLIIDSLSHAWSGKDGALEQVDKAQKRSQSGNSFAAWREATPHHNALVDAIIASGCHVIATMRTKTEYVVEQNEKGRNVPKKIGLAPVQRDGVEYEFDVVADMDLEHNLIVAKTRCHVIDGVVTNKPGEAFGNALAAWVNAGAAPLPKLQLAQNVISQSPAQGQGADAAASGSVSPAQTTLPDANVSHDPKPGAATVESSTSGATSTTPTSVTSAESISTSNTNKPQPIAAAPAQVALPEMQALLAAGNSNGWTKDQLLGFMEHVFKGSSTKGLKPDEYRVIYNCVLRPENKNGVAKYNSNGEGLAPNLHFPVAAK